MIEANHAGIWTDVSHIIFNTPAEDFDFISYILRIDGVVYKSNTKKFREAYNRERAWDRLNVKKTV